MIFTRHQQTQLRFPRGEKIECEVVRYGLRRDGEPYYLVRALDKRYTAGPFVVRADSVKATAETEVKP